MKLVKILTVPVILLIVLAIVYITHREVNEVFEDTSWWGYC